LINGVLHPSGHVYSGQAFIFCWKISDNAMAVAAYLLLSLARFGPLSAHVVRCTFFRMPIAVHMKKKTRTHPVNIGCFWPVLML
jgi:hypothetical protein